MRGTREGGLVLDARARARELTAQRRDLAFERGHLFMELRELSRQRGELRISFRYARMELAQDKARRVPFKVKALASIRTAMRIGCPF